MSDFENEYKKYAKESTPDLWARIEAGIDAYEEESKVVPITATVNKKKVKISKYIGIIAAAACLLIAVPAIISINHSNNKMSDFASAKAEAPMEYEPSDEEAVVAEAVVAEAPATEAPAAETFDTEEAAEIIAEDMVKAPAKSTAATKEAEDFANESESIEESADLLPIRVTWESKTESKIHIFFDSDIENFKVVNLVITDCDEDGNLKYTYSDEYVGGTISAGEELVLEMSFPGDIPNHAFCYTDQNGDDHVIAITESGKDGSIELFEI